MRGRPAVAKLALLALALGFARASEAAVSATETFAAQELAAWIGRLAEKGPAEEIKVGVSYIDLFPADKAALEGTDGFACRRKDGTVYIFSPQPRGVLYGVYAFLERNSDLIWARPDATCGTVYSRKPAFEIVDADFLEKPQFLSRGWLLCGKADESSGNAWKAHMRCNVTGVTTARGKADPAKVAAARKLGLDVAGTDGHNLPQYFSEKLLDEHPEYCLFVDGRREKGKQVGKRQFCYSCLESAESAAKAAIWQIRKARKRKDLPFDRWGIKQADSKAFCACEKCRAPIVLEDGRTLQSDEEGFKSTLFFRWLNRMVEPVVAAFPDLRIDTFAYLFSAAPPAVRLHPSLEVAYCPFIKNDRRPVFSDANAKWRERTLAWRRAAENVRVREYWGCAASFPRPNSLVAAEDLKWYRKLGIARVYSETSMDAEWTDRRRGEEKIAGSKAWDASALEHWVLSRLMWNPDVPVGQLRDEYCARTYRKAAAPMRRFYAKIAEAWFRTDAPTYWRDDAYANAAQHFLRAGIADELKACLDEAARLAADEVPATREILRRQRAHFDDLLAGAAKMEAPVRLPARLTDFFVTGAAARENNTHGKPPMTADLRVEGRRLKASLECAGLPYEGGGAWLVLVDGEGRPRTFSRKSEDCVVTDAPRVLARADFDIDLDALGIGGNRVRLALGCDLGFKDGAEYLKHRAWRGVAADDVRNFGTLVLADEGASAPPPPSFLGPGFAFDPSASDEFDGAKLDGEKWLDWVASFPGRSQGYLFARDNVAVKDGKLELTARLMREDEKTVENLRRGFDTYATGMIKAQRKTHYGYYECRAKTMHANVCNAFWLYDPLSDQPKRKFRPGDHSDEIDIFELFGKKETRPGADCDRKLYFNVHCLDTPYLEGVVNSGARKLPNKAFQKKVDFDFWADYHVYGFLWTEERLTWFVDGQEMFSRTNDVFKRPLHVTFNCEIKYTWTGEPDKADLPQSFSVDYFRFWKLKTTDQTGKDQTK